MSSGLERLDTLLSRGGLLVAPGVFDGFSARAVELEGFEAAYVTGAGSSLANFGLPDIGLVTQSDMVDHISRLREATNLPLIVDGDTGYGNPLNVYRTVQRYERAGAAAIQLEDQVFPKRCGHLPGKQVVATADFEVAIKAAVDARDDKRFRIIARTDAIAPLGFAEAIDRANRYAAAGADLIFVEAPETTDQIRQIAAEVDSPLMVNLMSASLTPLIPQTELEEMGFALAIYPLLTMVSSMNGMRKALSALRKDGDDRAVANLESPIELFELFDLTRWTKLSERYG